MMLKFSIMMGETLGQFIQRIRIEKSATLLIGNSKKSITEIAFDCGFSGSATFARTFRDYFGMSASQWRSGGFRQYRKKCKTTSKKDQIVSKIGKDIDISFDYIMESKTIKQRG